MRNKFNSKGRVLSRLEELKNRPLLSEKDSTSTAWLRSNQGIGNIDGFMRKYKAKETRLLEAIDKMLEEPIFKEPLDRTFTEKRALSRGVMRKPASNKSSNSIQKTQTSTTTEYRVTNKPPSRQMIRPPVVTAKNWIIVNADTQEVVYGHRVYEEKEVASVTKIMTCLVAIDFIEKYNIDIDKTHYLVSRKAATVGGTTANLKKDDYVCIRDLLYGLMLPSGNDAAQTLAENVITHRYILDKHKNCNPNELSYDEYVPEDKNLEAEFYYLMNKKARELNLYNTNYDSSHGLMNEDNFSCCYDQARLSVEAMKHPMVQEIVSTTSYNALIERNNRDCELVWVNTNKLLEKRGYKGVKTGVTKSAGGCLSTNFSSKGLNLVTIVLGCRDTKARFTDSDAINTWVVQNYQEIMELPSDERYSH